MPAGDETEYRHDNGKSTDRGGRVGLPRCNRHDGYRQPDHQQDREQNHGYVERQTQPAGFVAVVYALHQNCDARPQCNERKYHQYYAECAGHRGVRRTDRDQDFKDEHDHEIGQHELEPILRARNPPRRREIERAKAGPHVFRLDQIDLGGALSLGLEVDDIAMPRLRAAPPVPGGEVVAVAVMAADCAGIGVGVEPDDVALHGGPLRCPPMVQAAALKRKLLSARLGTHFRLAGAAYHIQDAGRS